ncbi:MAG: hypothetical protein MUP76_04635 [Acidimicrobiia bacterium]|nr:hypothetical protein [Acidimicrobiia bacterium]
MSGSEIKVDPHAVHDGYIYPVNDYGVLCEVRVVGRAEEIPASEPLRYQLHICARVGHPRGGG